MSSTNLSYPSASQTPTTISDIEQTLQNGLEALRNAPLNDQITAALKFLVPPGFRPVAQLEEDRRKKRSTAAASNWNPETGEIVIYFERQEPDSRHPVIQSPPTISTNSENDLPDKKGELRAKMQNWEKSGLRENSKQLPPVERVAAARNDALAFLAEPKVTDSEIQQLCIALAEAEKAGKAFIALKWFRDNELTTHGYAWAESLAYRQAVLAKAFDVGAIQTTPIPNPKAPQHPTTTIRLNRESKYAQAVAPRFQPIKLRGEGPTASEILLRDRERF